MGSNGTFIQFWNCELVPRKTAKTRQENEETANHPWTASPQGSCRSLVCSQKTGGMDLMQLEEAYAIEITKLVEYVDKGSYANTDCQNAPTRFNSAVLQTVRCLKTELQRGTRQIQDSIAEKTKERWRGKMIHGQLSRGLDEKLVHIEQSY